MDGLGWIVLATVLMVVMGICLLGLWLELRGPFSKAAQRRAIELQAERRLNDVAAQAMRAMFDEANRARNPWNR